MITYAQNREDVLLQRAFSQGFKGFYVDVGANEPVRDSVTKHFSIQGWRGINIEPHPDLHRMLCEDRPDDINLNIGASDRHATLEFLECPSNFGLSTFSPSMAEHWRYHDGLEFIPHAIPVRPLAEIFEEHVKGEIDFLKIDAEAHEREVISGNEWSRWRPRIVLVEATFPERWEPLLLEAGYLSAAFDGLNLYYVRGEEPDLLKPLKAPLSSLDSCIPHWFQCSIDDLKARADHLERHASLAEAELERYRARVAEAEAELARYRDIGPSAMRIAHKVQGMARHHPRLSRACKRMIGLGPSSS